VGLRANRELLRDLVDRKSGCAMVQEDVSSKTQGLFVAGDARNKTLRQISTAVGDGALAAERGQI
jgi:thioredoxin reductase (NADPH)